jgi:hypothetical protein
MSNHQQDEQWDNALREHPPIATGRLDMASYTIDGQPIRYLYCDAWPERIPITGDHCDFIAYAANRAQPLLAEVGRLRDALKDARDCMMRVAYWRHECLDDPDGCDDYKSDINAFFGMPDRIDAILQPPNQNDGLQP